MIAINKKRRRSLVAAIATVALSIPIASSACSPPPPPIDYDARLAMVVTPDQPGAMGVGATGRIDFDVGLLSSPTLPWFHFLIVTRGEWDESQLLAPGAVQPIKLTATADNICPFSEVLRSGNFGPTYVYSLFEAMTLQAAPVHCSMRFEVLPAAGQMRSLEFELIAANIVPCRRLVDVSPADNTVAFTYGGAAQTQAVPMGGRFGWLVLAFALAIFAVGGMAVRRRKLRLS